MWVYMPIDFALFTVMLRIPADVTFFPFRLGALTQAGITTTLNSRCSVLAAANSVFGRWDETKGEENIDFMPTILSRFDMIFIVKDEHNEERDMVGGLGSSVYREGTVGETCQGGQLPRDSRRGTVSSGMTLLFMHLPWKSTSGGWNRPLAPTVYVF